RARAGREPLVHRRSRQRDRAGHHRRRRDELLAGGPRTEPRTALDRRGRQRVDVLRREQRGPHRAHRSARRQRWCDPRKHHRDSGRAEWSGEGAAGLTGIAAGPDGKLWFTEAKSNRIGNVTPDLNTISEFAIGISPVGAPSGITAGPDGAMWFTERGGGGI